MTKRVSGIFEQHETPKTQRHGRTQARTQFRAAEDRTCQTPIGFSTFHPEPVHYDVLFDYVTHGTTSCPLPSWYGYANVAVQFGAITNGSVCTIVLTWLPETTNAHISGQSSRIWTHQSSVGDFSRNKNAGLVRMFFAPLPRPACAVRPPSLQCVYAFARLCVSVAVDLITALCCDVSV